MGSSLNGVVDATDATAAAGVQPVAAASRTTKRWLDFKRPIAGVHALALGIAVWVLFFAAWELAVATAWVNPVILPPPHRVLTALWKLFAEQHFIKDVLVSCSRILVSFALACAVAVPLGILMGSFRAVEAFFNPFVAAWRYLPAPSFIPLLLMWFGTGEGQKAALLFLGVVFFMTTLVMDHTRTVRNELIETSMTLGGSRRQILWTVVVPAAMPQIVTAMRQMLAVSWTYLTIAEIIASTDGIGAMMMRAKRFLHVDEIMAGIVVIGVLGLFFDFLFRCAHRRLFPYIDARER